MGSLQVSVPGTNMAFGTAFSTSCTGVYGYKSYTVNGRVHEGTSPYGYTHTVYNNSTYRFALTTDSYVDENQPMYSALNSYYKNLKKLCFQGSLYPAVRAVLVYQNFITSGTTITENGWVDVGSVVVQSMASFPSFYYQNERFFDTYYGGRTTVTGSAHNYSYYYYTSSISGKTIYMTSRYLQARNNFTFTNWPGSPIEFAILRNLRTVWFKNSGAGNVSYNADYDQLIPGRSAELYWYDAWGNPQWTPKALELYGTGANPIAYQTIYSNWGVGYISFPCRIWWDRLSNGTIWNSFVYETARATPGTGQEDGYYYRVANRQFNFFQSNSGWPFIASQGVEGRGDNVRVCYWEEISLRGSVDFDYHTSDPHAFRPGYTAFGSNGPSLLVPPNQQRQGLGDLPRNRWLHRYTVPGSPAYYQSWDNGIYANLGGFVRNVVTEYYAAETRDHLLRECFWQINRIRSATYYFQSHSQWGDVMYTASTTHSSINPAVHSETMVF